MAKQRRRNCPGKRQGHFGPQLTALIAYLTVVCRFTPRRLVRELLEQVLGDTTQSGQHSELLGGSQREAVAEPCAELEQQLPHELCRQQRRNRLSNRRRPTESALVATSFVFYKIALTRGAEVLVELLGEVFAGILCSDRCPTYVKYHKGEAQFCWAHYPESAVIQSDSAKFGLRGGVTGPCRLGHSR